MTANIKTIAITALVVVLAFGTGAYAAGKIGSKQIKLDAIKSKHLANDSVKARHLANGVGGIEIFRTTGSGTGSATAVCPRGLVIGGGFTGVQGEVAASDSGGDPDRWTVTVTGTNQPHVAVAYCFSVN
jgi:hypothetical protein